ncbi:restriction endonuclease subunit S [Cycloclasticus pugetii]|uniref:restriction endonuclease subunit S n=1 Tax=Cycloclasticus pugetii TaxID=34068 RepID=UPI000922298D|nr:restriction endonuclease subunit S [Cycloclasticus pugetii]SHJ03376.1 type I restriction enzyme, S subunit [Cycloclasticus pugetii]
MSKIIFNREYELSELVSFVGEKIEAEQVTTNTYISTDNMLVDRGGVEPASKLPSVNRFNHFKIGDTLFSNIRTYFRKVWLADFEGGASADVLIFRTDDDKVLDPYYLYFLLSNEDFVNYTVLTAKGAKMPRGDKAAIMQYKFLLPGIDKQREIGLKLLDINKKIQLNRQTNQTLEHIAQAIFKSWFVDFEPTRAKIIIKQKGGNELAQELAAQAVICGAITLHKLAELEEGLCGIEKELHPLITKRFPNKGGVDLWQPQQLAAIAALFPNSLVDSELGEVPEGWEVVGFKDIVEKYIDNRGKTPPTKESGIPLLEVKHLPEGSIKPNLNTSKYVDDETFESCFRAHLETDDIMISTVGTIGRICMVPAGKKIAIAQNLLGMRFNREKVSPYFMYYQMDGFRFRHDVDARLVITVQASIKRKDLETINLLGPPIELQNQFERCVLPFVSMQQTNQEIELADVRDTLLPKLLSGELTTVATQEANHV